MVNASLTAIDRATVLAWLGEVMDPELPVLSLVDLGIVRDVECVSGPANSAEASWRITVTPTYSACPATEVIAQAIRTQLQSHGLTQVEVITCLSPAWTTDWMSEAGREALRAYGIAPPVLRAPNAGHAQAIHFPSLSTAREVVSCPQCASRKTRLLSQFGSTACKALYQCQECLEPFDYFKPH